MSLLGNLTCELPITAISTLRIRDLCLRLRSLFEPQTHLFNCLTWHFHLALTVVLETQQIQVSPSLFHCSFCQWRTPLKVKSHSQKPVSPWHLLFTPCMQSIKSCLLPRVPCIHPLLSHLRDCNSLSTSLSASLVAPPSIYCFKNANPIRSLSSNMFN